MKNNSCKDCLKTQRRYGKLDFSTNYEGFPNSSPAFGCTCTVTPTFFNDDDYSEEECSGTLYTCSFCEQAFGTATELYFHTDQAHSMAKSVDNWDFYSMVGNSIIGNLDYFYYDQKKLNKLSDLIDALQTNVDRMKTITPIED